MTCEEYLSNMKPGYIVDGGSEEHLVMHELSQRALKITMEPVSYTHLDVYKRQDCIWPELSTT